MKTQWAIWYFGLKCDVASALKIRVADVEAWGEYVPEEHRETIQRIMDNDAQDSKQAAHN